MKFKTVQKGEPGTNVINWKKPSLAHVMTISFATFNSLVSKISEDKLQCANRMLAPGTGDTALVLVSCLLYA